MQLIKTYVGPSAISGLGLFAAEDIKQGTVTWKYVDNFDAYLTKEQVMALPEIARDFIEKYCALSRLSGKYVLYGDDTRFTNHSDNPNVMTVAKDGEKEALGIAARDIGKDEEITVDYSQFDEPSSNGVSFGR